MYKKNSLNKNDLKLYEGLGLLLIILFSILVVAFLYLDRRDAISTIIQNLGIFGVVLAIIIMAVLSMTPIPSEGLVILYIKIYGVILGVIISWLGSILNALIIFIIARYYGLRFLKKHIDSERFVNIDHWVKKQGTLGLFIARILPIPAYAVNYIASIMPSVKFWPYFWTAAVTIIPYYIGTALFYVGASRQAWIWLIIGGILIVTVWVVGYFFNRHETK